MAISFGVEKSFSKHRELQLGPFCGPLPSYWQLACFCGGMLANQCFEPTAHQRRWWVPFALRASAAAQAQR